jgi:hypothetical protein
LNFWPTKESRRNNSILNQTFFQDAYPIPAITKFIEIIEKTFLRDRIEPRNFQKRVKQKDISTSITLN